MVASEIRALFAVASRPEVVSLAGGMPTSRRSRSTRSAGRFGRLVAEHGTRGAAVRLRARATRRCASRSPTLLMPLVGVRAHPDDVVVTVGSQQALDLVTRVFVRPRRRGPRRGPVVRRRAVGVRGATRRDVVHVAMDEEGLVPGGAARGAGRAARRAGGGPSSSTRCRRFHNPAGVTQGPSAAGPRSWRCAPSTGVPVLEDDPYALLGFDGDRAARAARRRGRAA